MSKNKDIEKKVEKEIEKKLEKPELKEKPEKREIKEWKEIKEPFKEKSEIKERKEFKEPFKEKIEHKEIKEIEKRVPEKGGKDLVEGGFDPGEVFQPRTAAAPESLTADASAAKVKENEAKNPKEIEKIKAEKEFEKIHKDIEKIKPEKEFKIEKHEIKELKHEKQEIKEFKAEHIEKHLQKDFLPEKGIFENDPKGIAENPGIGPVFDPATRPPVFKGSGSAEDRLAELEDVVSKLSHFIGADLRPDLSSGALKGEPDVAPEATDESKADDKTKKPK
jgi:hypothetical protein